MNRAGHREQTLVFFQNSGMIPVPVRPGQKAPDASWDARNVAVQDHSLVIKKFSDDPESNIGALFCGRFVDIDIDNTNQWMGKALATFLTKTTYIWGRKSKPGSHLAYITQEDFDRTPFSSVLRLMKNAMIGEESYQIEIRGGKPDSNQMTVLPGSKHPSGELYEWQGESDLSVMPVFISVVDLVKGVRKAVAAAMICDYWGPGVRNDMSLALAGLMWRIRASTLAASGVDSELDMDPAIFCLKENDANDIIEFVIRNADDNSGDHRARRLNFINTWKKLDKDPSAKVTGGKVLAELVGGEAGEVLLKFLYRLLSDNTAASELEHMAENFCIWYGQGLLIDLGMVTRGHDSPWMTRGQARDSMGDKKIIIGDKRIPMVNILFDLPSVPRVMGFTFEPSSTEIICDGSLGAMINQWRGFAVEPHPEPVEDSEMAPLIEYLHAILASGEKPTYQWIIQWIAHIFQTPADKAGTALVLVGDQGAGKTFLGQHVIAPLIGDAHSSHLNNITDITAKFNMAMDMKVLIRCEEAIHAWQRDISSQMKSLITDDFIWIEPKNINRFKKPNHMRFIFTSNEATQAILVDSDPNERRYTVINISAHKVGQLKYWDELYKWIVENRPKIMRWFLSIEIDREFIRLPLQTEAKKELQRSNYPPELMWVMNRIQNGYPIEEKAHQNWFDSYSDKITEKQKQMNTLDRENWPDWITFAALERDFTDFLRSIHKKQYTTTGPEEIRKVFPIIGGPMRVRVTKYDLRSGQQTQTRQRVYAMPSRQTIHAHLKEKYGALIEDLTDD